MSESNLKNIVLAGGCFWCIEAVFQQIKGVEKIVSGYAGGEIVNPTYEQVCTGKSGHAEAVRVYFDPKIISLIEILEIFWHLHDPTTLNRQGADVGTQYRSAIFYESEDDYMAIQESLKKLLESQVYQGKIVTEISPLEVFYPAEEYHQNYFKTHPTQGYCQLVINPKMAKLRKLYFAKLKEE
jgi:peptide-methionine (S)-S-oxide reductase